MSEYQVGDYSAFSDATNTTKTLGNNVASVQDAINNAKAKLGDTSIFMGPAQENCMQVFQTLDTDFQSITQNYNSLMSLLGETSSNYQLADKDASQAILGSTSQLQTDTTTITTTPTGKSGVLSYKVGTLSEPGREASVLGKRATLLDVQVDGHSLGQDGSIVIKRGEKVHLKVKVPDEIQGVQTIKRTSADGAKGWYQYVSQQNTPNVDRNNPATFVNQREYDWYITGNTPTDNVTLSQTVFFTVPGTQLSSYKGMVRLRVKIV